jgi:hypothetical protein
MRTALCILNPREIPEVLDGIRSLNTDTCWISYMREADVAPAINRAIEQSDYDRYFVLSDDCVPTPEAFAAICKLHDKGHPVVTGYGNLDAVQDLCGITTNELTPPPPGPFSYDFTRTADCQARKGPITTTFAGLVLTGMSREMWLRYPLAVTVYGGQMDYDLSYRLGVDGVPIVAPPDAFCHHLKERANLPDQNPEKRLLIGERPPSITWTYA